MVVPAAVGTTLRTLFDQFVQWAMQSPERIALLIGAGLVTLFVGLLMGIRLSRWTVRTLLQLGVWLESTTWDVVADTVRRWRAPSVSATATQLGDGTEPHSAASELSAEGTREYLRIRPTSAEYDPETLVMALHGLQSHHRRSEISGNWRRKDQDTFEFLVATRGVDAGVEFYIGGSMSLDRLAATLPYRQCGFDVDRVSTHPAHLLAPSSVAESGDDTSPSEPGTTAPRPPSPTTAADGGTTAATEEGATENMENNDASGGDPTSALIAQLTDRGREPVVYRVNTHAHRWKDWMMRLPGFTDVLDTPGDDSSSSSGQSAPPPLTPVIEALDALEVPALYQVTGRSFRAWDTQADMREANIRNRRDTFGQQVSNLIFDEFFGTPERDHDRQRDDRPQRDRRRSATHDRDTKLPRTARDRINQLDEKDPNNTFVVNVRFAAVPTDNQSRPEVASVLRQLWSDLDHLDGDYYHLTAPPSPRSERVAGLLHVRGARHRQRLRRLCRRQLKTPVLGHTRHNLRKWWPDLVCSADELAAWTAVPSTAWLPSRLTEAVEHDPGHARPLQRLPPSVRSQYVGQDKVGRTAGYLFTPDSEPDLERPFRLPVSDLETHGLRQGLPNCGKTTDITHDILEDHHATAGPTIVVTGPGGDLGDLVMRGVAVEEDLDYLRECAHWFRIPVVQPGITFFDIRELRSAPDVTGWADAAGDIADKYVRVAEALMGSEAFQRAPLATDTLRALIAAGFDPSCYPPSPDDDAILMPHREQESADVYRFWQLEAQAADLADLTQAAAQQEFIDVEANLSDVSHPRLARNLSTPFKFDQRTAANIVGGVQTRLRAVSNNMRLAALFDNTVERFGFHTILEGADADDIFIFDLGALTPVSQRAYAITLLSLLDLQLRPRQDFLEREVPDEYLVNVHIDEAAQLVDTPELGEFLDVIRNYNVGLNLALQYPEQIRERGGERTYTSVLSNVQTTILGPSELSDEQARRLCPAGWEVAEFKAHVRDLPESHRLVLLPPQGDQTRPQVFELHRGPLPAWHPDAREGPFTDPTFRQRFAAVKDDVKERTQDKYGLPAGESEQDIRERREVGVPAVADTIGLARDNLAAFLALMTRHAQQAAAVDSAAEAGADSTVGADTPHDGPVGASIDTNRLGDDDDSPLSPTETDAAAGAPWVPVSEVYSRFMTQIDVALTDVDADEATAATETLPDHEDVATCVDESVYFETALATDVAASATAPSIQDGDGASGVVVRLTADGQQVAADLDEPGEGVTAGSAEHTALLERVQQALQRAGEIQLVTQDGSAQPDALGGLQRTVDGTQETITVTVEAERSTFRHPTKPLRNLQKAQERDAVALFAVPAGDPADGQDVAAYADRLATILADPINRQRDKPRYYVSDDRKLTLHGGARDGGETIVRRVRGPDDSGRSLWVKRDDTAVLVAPDGQELATVPDFDAVLTEGRLDEFPAYYTYDPRTGQYTVHEHGQHHRYEEKAELIEEWVPIKEPFIPERELPVPDYGPDTYAILVVGSPDTATVVDEGPTDIAVYLDGDVQPLERLVDGLQNGELQPPTTAASASRDVETDRHTAGHNTDGAEATTAEQARFDRDDLTPKQASVADFVRFLDGPALDEIETTDADTLKAGLRSDRVLDVYQTVEAQHGRPVYQRQSDLSRELSKYLGFVSKEERDPTTPEERYTRWNGLGWTNESVSTIAEKLAAEPDEERIDELVEILETTVAPSE